MGAWGEIILILAIYCGQTNTVDRDVCRKDRMECVRKNTSNPKYKNTAEILVDDCISNPYIQPSPTPSPSGYPVIKQ